MLRGKLISFAGIFDRHPQSLKAIDKLINGTTTNETPPRVSNFHFPNGPKEIGRGPVFRFNMNHVVEPADPYEMFPMDLEKI